MRHSTRVAEIVGACRQLLRSYDRYVNPERPLLAGHDHRGPNACPVCGGRPPDRHGNELPRYHREAAQSHV